MVGGLGLAEAETVGEAEAEGEAEDEGEAEAVVRGPINVIVTFPPLTLCPTCELIFLSGAIIPISG